MNNMLTLDWDFWCKVAGIIAIIGPLLLVAWYYKAAKHKISKLNKK